MSAPSETIIVVPCYNEAARFDLLAFDAFLQSDETISFVFVDDGSTDDTPLLLERMRARRSRFVSVMRLKKNVGKAEAVRRGMLFALARRPVMAGYWDADLATPLAAIRQFREILRSRPETQLIMGSRVALLGRQIRRRWSRHLLGRSFATAASLVLGLPVYDTQCGAKLFRATPATSQLFCQPFRTRWIFDVELLARMVAVARDAGGQPAHELIYECPLEEWQDVARSRLEPLDFLIAALDLAGLAWRNSRLGQRATTAGRADAPTISPPAEGVPQRRAA
jgi:glycosyltransferase involved in cell wall biosynthesis